MKCIKKIVAKVFKNKQVLEPFILTNALILGQRIKLLTHTNDAVLSAMFRGERPLCKQFESELSWLIDQIKPGDNFLDAGGNIGSVCIPLALKQPKANIYSFEPDPVNYALLQININLNCCNNIQAYNVALGNKEGLVGLYHNVSNFGDHRTSKSVDSSLNDETLVEQTFPVMKVPASAFLGQRYPSLLIDIAKIDTQGPDIEILEDVYLMLNEGAKVAIEFSPYHLSVYGTSKTQTIEILNKFKEIYVVNPEAGSSYSLKRVNCSYLSDYFDEKMESYSGYIDLILIN